MMKKLKIIILLIAIGGTVAYFVYQQLGKHDDPTKAKNKISINAVDFFKLYTLNEDRANKLYLDSVMDITGNISKIEKSDNRYTIYLDTKDSSGTISCEMDTLENNIIQTLSKGNPININGFCNGINIDIQLDRCKIVKNK